MQNNFESLNVINDGIPLSNTDIEGFINRALNLSGSDKVSTIIYDDLVNYSFEEILNLGSTFIFYQNPNSDIGHWCVLFYHHDNRVIEFFDSMGNDIDEVNVKIGNRRLNYFAQMYAPYRNQIKYVYNKKQLQSNYSNICGKYAISRLMSSKVPQDYYMKVFRNSALKPDQLVNLMYIIPVDEDYEGKHYTRE